MNIMKMQFGPAKTRHIVSFDTRYKNLHTTPAAFAKPVVSMTLASHMINRIHNVKPGCNSCGK